MGRGKLTYNISILYAFDHAFSVHACYGGPTVDFSDICELWSFPLLYFHAHRLAENINEEEEKPEHFYRAWSLWTDTDTLTQLKPIVDAGKQNASMMAALFSTPAERRVFQAFVNAAQDPTTLKYEWKAWKLMNEYEPDITLRDNMRAAVYAIAAGAMRSEPHLIAQKMLDEEVEGNHVARLRKILAGPVPRSTWQIVWEELGNLLAWIYARQFFDYRRGGPILPIFFDWAIADFYEYVDQHIHDDYMERIRKEIARLTGRRVDQVTPAVVTAVAASALWTQSRRTW